MNIGKKQLNVYYKGTIVGTLAEADTRMIAFQYDPQWIRNGFSISPFSLPLKDQVFIPKKHCFNGLFGVFADSLPDAWGRFVLDRWLSANHIPIDSLTVLDRLAIVGNNGAGALEYQPIHPFVPRFEGKTLDDLSQEINMLFASNHIDTDQTQEISSETLDRLFALGGSSGGARPKVFIVYNNNEWLVKFPYRFDSAECGLKEFELAQAAKSCGINMCEAKLFPSEKCTGYFGAKRFDRPKKHMISAAALLEVDFENSVADYHDLMKLTKILSHDQKTELEEMFRRMCFNVLIGNQDDHLKNFAWLYDEVSGWRLSPAFDLTSVSTAFGEHTTLVNGKGKDITDSDLQTVGEKGGLSKKWCVTTLDAIKKTLRQMNRSKI